ncbi:outer membrane lipoprotein carrier protein [Methylohalomonas lacus]|uniref:Outer-membrane lipoprotein carrier protein n=1 Tax=Methylohalomonas lacus TaxID=398773 RepID=A0AAE3HKG9_9GAMM|nr:outer membrane lipoprotein chaperone LolA [Methylohalomonas lacus]MCS3902774.1 outer membrane lipoprotein carrier protein [Methylohalomonas lacus]
MASVASGEDKLRSFLEDLDSLTADFEQQLRDESGDLLETSRGKLYLQRPGRFDWQYNEPYAQRILTDGDTLWIYDEDLEQVTIRDMEAGMQATPAAILGGSADIDELYDIVDLGELEGYDWVRLESRDEDSQYSDVRLGFDGRKLGMMILSDNFGQTTRIDFSNVELNPGLDTSRFEFTPPDGVDVIDDRAQ